MIIQTFLSRLHAGNEVWDAGFLGMGGIGLISVVFPVDVVRPCKDRGGNYFKPPIDLIAAVCFLEKQKLFPCHKWREAARALEICEDDALAIVNAEGMHHGYSSELRIEMLMDLDLFDKRVMLDWSVSDEEAKMF